MGARLQALVERAREAHGPFFVARVGLRVNFAIDKSTTPDSDENLRAFLRACRELGYDPSRTKETG